MQWLDYNTYGKTGVSFFRLLTSIYYDYRLLRTTSPLRTKSPLRNGSPQTIKKEEEHHRGSDDIVRLAVTDSFFKNVCSNKYELVIDILDMQGIRLSGNWTFHILCMDIHRMRQNRPAGHSGNSTLSDLVHTTAKQRSNLLGVLNAVPENT